MRRFAFFVLVLMVIGAYGAPFVRGQEPAPTAPALQNPASPVTSVPGTMPVVAPGAKTQAAVAVTTVPSPASPSHVPEQLEWAAGLSYLFERIKQWLEKRGYVLSATTKAQIGAMVAIITAAGIHFGVSGSFFDGDGAVTITGLSFNAFKDIAFQWIAQQGIYDKIVKTPTLVTEVKA